MTAQPMDPQAHMHPGNLASEGAEKPGNGRNSARRPARARAVPHLHLVDQDQAAETTEKPRRPLGAELLDEMATETAALAAESDFAEQHLTPVDAFGQILPERGEAGRNPIVWTAMSLAGLARFLIVSLGHTICLAGNTRIKAGVMTTVILLAIAASWLATAGQ